MNKLRSEGLQLEYKKAKNSFPREAWKTYSSFANTKGGLLVLGINDDLTIEGVNDSNKIKKEFFDSLNNRNKVSQNILSDENITVKNIEGKTVIEIFIPEAEYKSKPIYINNNLNQSYIRDYEADRLVTEEELKTLMRNSSDDLDNDLLNGFNINDLNQEDLRRYREMLSKYNDRYQNMEFEDMLKEIGAYKLDRQNQEYKLTIGGLLFFGHYNSITEVIPHFHLDYQNKMNGANRWNDRLATGDTRYPDLNLFSFFNITLEKLTHTINQSFELSDDMTREDSTKDVITSLREALANALIHADYRENLPIKVEVYDSYYIFKNPGTMKVSHAEFAKGGMSIPRNHTIMTLFRRVGICERAGTGGPHIMSAAEKHKFKFPDIESDMVQTEIKIWKVDIADAHPYLSSDAKMIIKLLTKKMLPLSSTDIKNDLNLSKYFFDKSIKELLDEGIIEVTGASRATKYRLKVSTPEYIANLHNMIKTLQDYQTFK